MRDLGLVLPGDTLLIPPTLDRAWTAAGGSRSQAHIDGATSSEQTAVVGRNLSPAGNNAALDPHMKIADYMRVDIPSMVRHNLIPLVANNLCWEDDSAFDLLSWGANSLL